MPPAALPCPPRPPCPIEGVLVTIPQPYWCSTFDIPVFWHRTYVLDVLQRVFVVSFTPGKGREETVEQQMDLLSATVAFLVANGNKATDEVSWKRACLLRPGFVFVFLLRSVESVPAWSLLLFCSSWNVIRQRQVENLSWDTRGAVSCVQPRVVG